MKRSEMIKLISEFLIDDLPQDREYLWKYADRFSNSLLNEIEEAGMLPPCKLGIYDKYTSEIGEFCFTWEPEE